MALGSNPYRKVFIDDMAKLQDLSVLAERAYIHLAFGQRSTACCLVRMKPDALRLELREHSRAKVTAALDELEAAGWVSIDRQTWTIALPVQSQRTPSENASVTQGKWKEAQKFPPSRQRDEVLNTLAQESARWESQSQQRGKDGGETVTRTSNSNSSSNRIPTVAKATVPPAIADGAAAMSNREQASEQGPPTRSRYTSFDPNWGQAPAPAPPAPPAPKAVKPEPKDKARPTFAQAVAYFREEGSSELEACKFCDYHDAGGWKIGRNPMKDWRAAARNWMRNATQYTAPTRGKIGREPAGKDWPTVDAEAPTSAVLDFSGSGTASQPDSWAEAEALKVWRKGGKQGAAPPSGGTSADYLPWLT